MNPECRGIVSSLPHLVSSTFSKRSDAGKLFQPAIRTKALLYETMTENGDLSRPSDSAPKKDLKQGEIDIRALQQKRHLAEITR